MKRSADGTRQPLLAGSFYTWVLRVVLSVVFGGSVFLLWWSVSRLPALERKLELKNVEIARLQNDVLDMQMKWNPQEADQVAARFRRAQEQLFDSPAEVARWQEDTKRQTNPFALAVLGQPAESRASPLPDKRLTVTPVTVELQSAPPGASTNSPYYRLLRLVQGLTTQKKRVDLVEFSVTGNSNSVSQARIGLQLWSLEKIAK